MCMFVYPCPWGQFCSHIYPEEALDGFLDGLPVKGVCAYYLEGSQSLNWDSAVRLMNMHGQVVFRTKAMDVVANISKEYTKVAQ